MATPGHFVEEDEIKNNSQHKPSMTEQKELGQSAHDEDIDHDDDEKSPSKRASIKRSDASSSNLHLDVTRNRVLAASTGFSLFAASILFLFIYQRQQWNDSNVQQQAQILLRCVLFPLCVTSYFDTFSYQYDTWTISLLFNPLRACSDAVTSFLDLSFTLFWPTGRNTHKRLMNAIVLVNIICVSVLELWIRIQRINTSSTAQDASWSDVFYWIKIVREVVKFWSFNVALALVFNFFGYHQNYHEINPWDAYRRQYANLRASLSAEYIFIILALFASLLSESYFIDNNEPKTANDVLFGFLCGGWRELFGALFVSLPCCVCVAVGFLTCLLHPWGRNLLKGLLTYVICITSQRTILTILSLIVVWEIKSFEKKLDKFIDDTFVNMEAKRIKDRFHDFETKKLHIGVLKEKLNLLILFIILERLISMALDFVNFYCGQKKNDWDTKVFVSRHLFLFVLIIWVFWNIARFNGKYPNSIIRRLMFFRLRNFAESCGADDSMVNVDELKQNEKEFELWIEYLEQSSLKYHFKFDLFGIHIDAGWFAAGFVWTQIGFAYSSMNSETAMWARNFLQCPTS